ncbi:MAG: hypothetical protein HQL32_16090 [Planctomycetes bacterium]|nr:hypothetical protein [Planctomycetota bacterium]
MRYKFLMLIAIILSIVSSSSAKLPGYEYKQKNLVISDYGIFVIAECIGSGAGFGDNLINVRLEYQASKDCPFEEVKDKNEVMYYYMDKSQLIFSSGATLIVSDLSEEAMMVIPLSTSEVNRGASGIESINFTIPEKYFERSTIYIEYRIMGRNNKSFSRLVVFDLDKLAAMDSNNNFAKRKRNVREKALSGNRGSK